MGFLSWIILGLIAGALGKWLMPGVDGGGFFNTMILGIIGALVGGWIGSIIGIGSIRGLNLGSIFTATFGAFLVLYIYKKIKEK
ncbi:MAG: GlsB/YeaQ/YmgE family stress response membrane protein [Cetobacterium sp.]|uniref:GlsB/YeaQ/YmgE family stress response membrane protein n=1 Tax=unclassified Cetobacterium TaxID=2630983 RepID=UPI00163BDCCC|nr:GlsB/YeaQ/YmgE family stress response membrane protein [Cetobacterium sp. 2A]MBC2856046.1 GlsB/YeaQ/YmgE family stress response membrane protein [Cetobacterium sp. 2A]